VNASAPAARRRAAAFTAARAGPRGCSWPTSGGTLFAASVAEVPFAAYAGVALLAGGLLDDSVGGDAGAIHAG